MIIDHFLGNTQAEPTMGSVCSVFIGPIESVKDAGLVFRCNASAISWLAFNETTFTNERQKAAVTIHKQDGETKNPLAGGTFALYAASAITSYKGDNLVAAGTLIETVQTGTDGSAAFAADLPVGFKYEVREVAPPAGYTFGVDKYGFAFSAVAQTQAVSEFGYTFSNDRITAMLNLHKKDVETAFEQGDAQLAGAVYALYAREAIVHPDGKTGTLYEKDALVTTLTTDAAGDAKAENLPLGKYYLKEITPSAGYLLDAKAYEVNCTKYDPSKYLILVEATVKEQVIKQPFQVIKAANNGKTDADLIKGAGFTAWLVSDLMKNADGSYNFSSAESVALGANGETEIFTDEKGHATSIPLPFGTYIVRETTTPKNYAPVDDFIVTIKENNPAKPQIWRVLLDEEFAAKLKIYKVDSATGRTILLPGAEFSIYDVDNDTFVEQVTTYPQTVKHTTFTTDESGTLTLPETLRPGHYRITEINAPFGYTLNRAEADVTISDEALHQVDAVSGDLVIEITMHDAPARGRVTVYKEGEMLSRYEKDTLIEQRATDSNGKLTFEIDLPVGFDYAIKEITPPAGYASDPNAQTFTFDGSNTDVAVVEMEYTFEDMPTLVDVTKSSLTTGEELEGASLQVTDEDGNVIDSWISEKEPHRITGLVVGKTYTLTETLPASGYATAESIVFTISDTGDVQPVEMKDDVTKVKISKTDLTGKKELEGAKLTILDSEGKVVETWTSTTEPHYIEMLPIGKYTLREETAPSGYLVAEEVEFEIKDTAEIQTVTMKDAEENPEQPGTPMPDTPKTGDMNNPFLWGGIGVVALLGLMTAVLVMRKNRRKF